MRNLPPKKKKKPNINQCEEKGSPPEKTLVLTLGSPPEKGEEKKTLVLTLGSPPEKGGEKNKTLVLTLGSPPEKGGKKKKKNQRRFRHRKRSAECHIRRTHEQTSELIQ